MEFNDILSISILIATICIILVSLLIFFMVNRNKRYSENIGMADMRRYYEREIYELNQKLTSNNTRWQDSYHLLNNHIQYNPISEASENIRYSKFLKRHGLNIDELTIDKRSVFVLMPFLDSKREIFYNIEKVCSEYGFNCSMGDDEYITGDILPYVLKKIAQARIVIASIDGRNSNVFYELGIAHALDKPTILISNYNEKGGIPIDLNSKYIIFYSDYNELRKEIKKMINKLLID